MLMVSRMTARQVVALMTKGDAVQFVDARAESSWTTAAEQVPGSVRVREGHVTRDATGLPRNCQLVVYGADDGEAHVARVADALRVLGFGPVRILEGGFAAWRELHAPVQRKEAA